MNSISYMTKTRKHEAGVHKHDDGVEVTISTYLRHVGSDEPGQTGPFNNDPAVAWDAAQFKQKSAELCAVYRQLTGLEKKYCLLSRQHDDLWVAHDALRERFQDMLEKQIAAVTMVHDQKIKEMQRHTRLSRALASIVVVVCVYLFIFKC